MAGTQLTDQFLLLLQLCGSSGVWLAGDVPVPNGDCGDTCVPLLSKSSQQPGIIRPWERLSHSPLSRSYAFKICAPSDCSLSLSLFLVALLNSKKWHQKNSPVCCVGALFKRKKKCLLCILNYF